MFIEQPPRDVVAFSGYDLGAPTGDANKIVGTNGFVSSLFVAFPSFGTPIHFENS
jgi:hypothetical protein